MGSGATKSAQYEAKNQAESLTSGTERAWEKYNTRSVLMYEAKEAMEGKSCREPKGIRKSMRDRANILRAKISLGCGCVQFDEQIEAQAYQRSTSHVAKQNKRMQSWIQTASPAAAHTMLPHPTPSTASLGCVNETISRGATNDSDTESDDPHDEKPATPLNSYVLKHHNSLLKGNALPDYEQMSPMTSPMQKRASSHRRSLGSGIRLEGSSGSDAMLEDTVSPPHTVSLGGSTLTRINTDKEDEGLEVVDLPEPVVLPKAMSATTTTTTTTTTASGRVLPDIPRTPSRPSLRKSESFRVRNSMTQKASGGSLAAALKLALQNGEHAPVPTPPARSG